jgi:hypothetical protein
MNVNGVSGAPRIAPPVTPVQPVDGAAREPRANTSLIEIDSKTQLPVLPRFPWLSRLSAQLSEASGQPAPFGRNPDLGDRVDEKV